MKEALKVLVRTKEEISECNQKLAQELEDERMTNIQLRENIERMKAEIAKTTESHTHQIQGLERYEERYVEVKGHVNYIRLVLSVGVVFNWVFYYTRVVEKNLKFKTCKIFIAV